LEPEFKPCAESGIVLDSELTRDYEIICRISQGGMGTVYKARQIKIDRLVALKVVSVQHARDSQALSRFKREAHILTTLEHPNVVRVWSFGATANQLFIAMEYLQGKNLAELLADGPLSREQFASIFTQVLQALCAVQERGIVHRDLKPANIMVQQSGVVKLVDFGIARLLESDGTPCQALTRAGEVFGTPEYMSPEQCLGTSSVDARTDLYSICCVMFEALTGKPPFSGDSPMQVFQAHLNAPVPEMPDEDSVAASLPAVVFRGLQKDPDRRYQSASELLEDLGRALSERGTPAQVNVGQTRAANRSFPVRPVPKAFLYGLLGLCMLTVCWFSIVLYLQKDNSVEFSGRSVVEPPSSSLPAVEAERNAGFLFERANRERDQGDYKNCISDFRRALASWRHNNPGDIETRSKIETRLVATLHENICHVSGFDHNSSNPDWQEVLQLSNHLIAQHEKANHTGPDATYDHAYVDASYYVAQYQQQTGLYKEAVSRLNKALEYTFGYHDRSAISQEDTAWVYLWLAQCQHRHRDFNAAVALYDKAIKHAQLLRVAQRDQVTVGALADKSEALLEVNRIAEARKALVDIISYPGNAENSFAQEKKKAREKLNELDRKGLQ
jgi:serine/threonine protein kinase